MESESVGRREHNLFVIHALQLRIERSFELDIWLKSFCMKQKKIDKDQRILPLTAIAIDSKLWGF